MFAVGTIIGIDKDVAVVVVLSPTLVREINVQGIPRAGVVEMTTPMLGVTTVGVEEAVPSDRVAKDVVELVENEEPELRVAPQKISAKMRAAMDLSN